MNAAAFGKQMIQVMMDRYRGGLLPHGRWSSTTTDLAAFDALPADQREIEFAVLQAADRVARQFVCWVPVEEPDEHDIRGLWAAGTTTNSTPVRAYVEALNVREGAR